MPWYLGNVGWGTAATEPGSLRPRRSEAARHTAPLAERAFERRQLVTAPHQDGRELGHDRQPNPRPEAFHANRSA